MTNKEEIKRLKDFIKEIHSLLGNKSWPYLVDYIEQFFKIEDSEWK